MNYLRLSRKINESLNIHKPCFNRRIKIIKVLRYKARIMQTTLDQKVQINDIDKKLEILENEEFPNLHNIKLLRSKLNTFILK